MSEESDNWPPKFTITPRGAAGLFLQAHCPTCDARVAIDALETLLKIHWESGYDAAKREETTVTMRFCDLPKGARFKYPDGEDVWVVLEGYGDGLVARWDGLQANNRHQSLCCFVDGENWTLESEVEVIKG